jgi:hypothetical protein
LIEPGGTFALAVGCLFVADLDGLNATQPEAA